MSDITSFREMMPSLMAMHVEEIRVPDMPIPNAILEAEVMLHSAQKDAPVLIAAGLNADSIQELHRCLGCLRYAQAIHNGNRDELSKAAKDWRDLQVRAKGMRHELLASLSFVTRHIPDAVIAIRKIRENHSQAQWVHDLMALVQIGKFYAEKLEGINFDLKTLDEAHALAEALFMAYAQAKIERSATASKDIRDRAFTRMRKIMAHILVVAEYALRNDPIRLKFYHSAFRQRRHLRALARKRVATSTVKSSQAPKEEAHATLAS